MPPKAAATAAKKAKPTTTAAASAKKPAASRKRKAESEPAAAKPAAPKKAAKPKKSVAEVVKPRLAKKLVAAIKRTPHSSQAKMPYTEVQEGLTVEEATELLVGKCTKQTLTEEEDIKKWLGMDDLVVHPVNSKGMKVWCRVGREPPKLHLHAEIIQLEVRYTKTTKLLQVKARTALV